MIYKVQLILCCLLLSIFGSYAQESIYDLLPNDDCQPIRVSGDPELYVGDDLFNLINGGAELYHEFGFVEVLAFQVSVSGNDVVKAEIYDMGSSEAAWGIFSLTATSHAEKIEVGDAARKGDGFLQFIKGSYMVYIYYSEIGETGLNHVAACIADKISSSAGPPQIMEIVSKGKENRARLDYFKGNLGLSSIYNFYYKDVFGYKEGAAAIYDDLKVFLLDYNNEVECLESYNSAKDFFFKSTKYHNQKSLGGSFHMKDKKERRIDCYFENSFLLIFVYSGERDHNEIKEAIVAGMDK